ncbi:alkaline phosphatase [Streptomyces sp. NPDC001339]|uniref:alkaline phosphatase n=1 Tax=Streptomyces sp. NPDC001339 TaxID=3364563 RepID=UPI00369CE39D
MRLIRPEEPSSHQQTPRRKGALSRRGLAAGAAALLAAGLVVPAAASAPTAPGNAAKAAPHNVILLIGDGMGDSEITLARDYTVGAGGRLALDGLPSTGTYTTYSVRPDGSPEYVTDSAAAASSWATGEKTANGRISTSPRTHETLPTILELAHAHGYATGSVTTAELTDATPAALVAHVADRECQGPADMAKCPGDAAEHGGAGSIAEQALTAGADVLLGGGRQRFEQRALGGPYKGRTVLERSRELGHQVVTDAAGLRRATPGRPVLGLFAPGAVPVEWTGERAAVGGTAPQRCVTANPARPAGTPTLAEQTRKALGLLQGSSDRGFFLQVEGASIDEQDHAADPCGQIGETAAFDRAVKVARDYAAAHPGTLVIATADHGHASQIVPLDAEPPGRTTTLVTDEGAHLKVNYGTGAADDTQEHTGTQVRIAAQGPLAERVSGVTDQTGLFTTLRKSLQLPKPTRAVGPGNIHLAKSSAVVDNE